MPEPSTPLTTDRTLAGRYRLVRAIARGGMAEVWEGHDEVLARSVAVKVLHPHLAGDEAFAERFRREAVAAARLAHPHIVHTFDTGTDGDTAFIVMELVRGQTLRERMEGGDALAPAFAVQIAIDVADALDCAHRNGLVHRDVKPGNILLAESPGSKLCVKVADFGIAKLEAGNPDLTQTGAVIGTAKYLSPEQVEGRTPDARSDVYALGVVLYEMLCGRPPFTAETELATALQHVNGNPVPPRRVVAGIPKPLEAVVLKALAKDPAERYQSAADVRAALASIDLGDDAEPFVVGGDPTPASGISPLPRRARRTLAPLVVLAVVGIVAVVLAAELLRSSGGGGSTAGPAKRTTAAAAVKIASATPFDPPPGDGHENDESASSAIDGNPATVWRTNRYDGPHFGNLKDGVGLVLTLGSSSALGELKVFSPVRGWSAQVYVAASPAASLSGWGTPAASLSDIPGDATFNLHGRRGAAVLLWITDPGPDNKAEIADVSLVSS